MRETATATRYTLSELAGEYRAACARRDATCRCWGCVRAGRGDRPHAVVRAYLSVHEGRDGGPCVLCADAALLLSEARP